MRDHLFCTACRREFPIDSAFPRCDGCNEPLEVSISRAKPSIKTDAPRLLERFLDFMPLASLHAGISLGEGDTPLVKSSAAARETGIDRLYFKNEALNPTWSFKDRGTIACIEHALNLGYERIGTVSTGNMAASVAAYGARAGLQTYILVGSNLPEEKIAPIAIYSPRLILVDGDYGDLYFRSLEIGKQRGVYFMNSDVPFRVEGSKTIAFEICEQMGFEVPDNLVVPVSSGGNFRGIIKGFEEFLEAGLIDGLPRFIAAQADGCSPIADAFENNREAVERIVKPNTIAKAIANPYPPSGNQVLRKLRQHGGIAMTVSDAEIESAQELLARDGIFGQPAAAAPLAAVRKLVSQGTISGTQSVACVVSGAGVKSMSHLAAKEYQGTRIAIEKLQDVFR